MIDIDCMNNKTDEDLAPSSQHSHISYREILEKFCKAFNLELVFGVNHFKEKTCTLHYCFADDSSQDDSTRSIVNRMFGLVFNSTLICSSTDSEEEVCQKYISFILGCDVFDTCVLVGSDHIKTRKKVASVPETLEELGILVDLALVEKSD